MPTPNQKQLAFQLISQEGCEGFRSQAYRDTKGIPTIGSGTIKYPDGSLVKMGDTCTREQAADWVNDHLSRFVYPAVDRLQALYSFSDLVYAAFCSLAYNTGSVLQGKSILAALKAKSQDMLNQAFRLYINQIVNGIKKPVQGLANRREIEINFMKGA